MDEPSNMSTTSSKIPQYDFYSDVDNLHPDQFRIQCLPGRNFISPLVEQKKDFVKAHVIHDKDLDIMYDPMPKGKCNISQSCLTLPLACPRVSLHFDPSKTTVAMVTCGGVCPGLNDVIRGITLAAVCSYHVKKVIGFKYGYWGLSKAGRHTAIELTSNIVRGLRHLGGTFLGTSRGGQNISDMVDTLVEYGVNILFTIGGDGTQKGAVAISEEVNRRGLDIAVFGIPKTIDNDLSFSQRTFGYETAVSEAVIAIRAAHAEAISHEYGVGIVKLMGRNSGFIAASATVASALSHICLIPEKNVSKEVLLSLIERRFMMAKDIVIVVAEGFGQDWPDCNEDLGSDASGNKRLTDIGLVIKKIVQDHLSKNPKYHQSTVKYIDPSYMIRACPASTSDAAFCSNLSTLAVHEAMAGRTACLITLWYSNFVLVPIKTAVSHRKIVSTGGALWRQVREVTVDGSGDIAMVHQQELSRELKAINAHRNSIMEQLSKL
eukprot:Tbor_TRINITY_DN5873_c0_g4::TRINITY_DN5873_c0_g4_i1::g.7143::m.7143/K00850/pfkA, PFK; 6-phosphofructokinase 1